MSIVCSKCGIVNVDQASFCKNCGSKLESKTNKYTEDTKKETNGSLTWILWLIAGFFVIIYIVGIFSERNRGLEENESSIIEMNTTEANATVAPEANATATEANATADAAAVDGAAAYAACGACHGSDGNTAALGKSAIIAGQSAYDIEHKLNAYRAGTRDVTGNGALMKEQTANLNDDQIKALADYISTLDSHMSSSNMQIDKNLIKSQAYAQNTFFSQNNVKNFLESHLHSGCFRSIYDVSYYFSKYIYRYYNFTNPTYQMLFDDNKKYCAKWNSIAYELNSFNILNRSIKDGYEYAEVIENINYTVSNNKRKINGTIDLILTLVNENDQIKIVSMYSKNNKKTTHANTLEDIYPNDYLKPYAYEFITGKNFVTDSDIVVNYNSNGIKIYCLSDMSICKTEAEVNDYIRIKYN